MITAKNYAAQAEAGIREWPNRFIEYKNKKLDVFMAKYFADEIKNAVHFAIPDNGVLFDDELKGIKGVKLRLPYKSITIEYYVDGTQYTNNPETPTDSPKRLLLAKEIKKTDAVNELNKLFDGKGDKLLSNFDDEYYIETLVANEIDGKWSPCAMSIILFSTWDYVGPDVKRVEPLIPTNRKTGFVSSEVIAFPGIFGVIVNEIGYDKALQEARHDVAGEVTSLLEFLEALTCSNITTETLQHENKAVNQKRINKKKLPLYETKILTIETHKTVSASGITHADRRGPRQHLRRGHIRRLSDDRKIWVNSCVIGSIERGRIDKSYNVKHTANIRCKVKQ